ncbi:MAG: hypothetical protein IPK32_24535 [Verrucomicrobiaceae bacterium]|nr:hypothetical protein [Verrucomicrobiaceae bacterium]
MSTLVLDPSAPFFGLFSTGEPVIVFNKGEKLGVFLPTTPKPQSVPLPDFRARLRKTWGSRVFSDAEVKAMREAELEHCHG